MTRYQLLEPSLSPAGVGEVVLVGRVGEGVLDGWDGDEGRGGGVTLGRTMVEVLGDEEEVIGDAVVPVGALVVGPGGGVTLSADTWVGVVSGVPATIGAAWASSPLEASLTPTHVAPMVRTTVAPANQAVTRKGTCDR
jgi:hypothetical protein